MNLATFGFIFSASASTPCATAAQGRHQCRGRDPPDRGQLFHRSSWPQLPIIGGLSCYVISVGVWIIGLSRVDVTIAYPLLSLGYIINAIGAWYFLGEAIRCSACWPSA
jgi:drug/metabolite transporter (DMT)-like permease